MEHGMAVVKAVEKEHVMVVSLVVSMVPTMDSTMDMRKALRTAALKVELWEVQLAARKDLGMVARRGYY
jgi:hypothetical protein